MPAEWAPHEATWLSWPYNLETWEGHLEGAEEAFAAFIEILSSGEIVHLLVPNNEVEERARKKLASRKIPKGALQLHRIETGDVWFRDFGPLFISREENQGFSSREPTFSQEVRSASGPTRPDASRSDRKNRKSNVAWVRFRYNALGNKYDDLLVGDTVPDKMPLKGFPRFDAGIVLEGGSIDVNGSGSLLTTESCLLNPNRNPSLTKAKIEQTLKDFLGITNVLWLKAGIAGDDTDGHVDDVTRFVDASTVLTVLEEDPHDENFSVLQENFERLKTMQNEQGNNLHIVTLPMPRPLIVDDRRMAASYANFYIANAGVIVPLYKQPSDELALDTFRKVFPKRKIVGIDCTELIVGY